MKPLWIALLLAACSTLSASAALGEPPTDPLASLAAVQHAPDPATAADAYQRGLESGADRMALNRSYVHRLIELGLPGQAEEAAERIVAADPQDGVAWAVLAYCSAARNDTTAALAEMATAIDYAPDDPFVLGVAGKLMAWYRYPGLGDPRELSEELALRLDEIHAAFSTNEYYSAAFAAAYEYYASQAGLPIAESPDEIADVEFEDVRYDPVVCTTYNETVYSGFTVPSFSYGYVVPRVRTYVIYERPVHVHLHFCIRDRHARYRSPVHVRRVTYERYTRRAAFHLAVRVRITPPCGVTLPPPRPRYVRTTLSSRPVTLRFGPTRPPPPAPRLVTMHRSSAFAARRSAHPRATGLQTPRWSAASPQAPRSSRIGPPRAEGRPQLGPPTPAPRPGIHSPPPRPEIRPPPRSRADVRTPMTTPTPRSRSEVRPQPRPDARPPRTTPAPQVRPAPPPRTEVRPPSQSTPRTEVRPPAPPTPRSRSEVRPQPRPNARPPRTTPAPQVRPAPPARSEVRPPSQSTPRTEVRPPAPPTPRSRSEVRPQPRPNARPPRTTPAPQVRPSPPPPRTEVRPPSQSTPRTEVRPPAPPTPRSRSEARPPPRSPERPQAGRHVPTPRPSIEPQQRVRSEPQPSRTARGPGAQRAAR